MGGGRWIASTAVITVLSGGLLFYERHEQSKSANHQVIKVSDAQLAEDVGHLAQDPEPQPTGPLRALFQE